MGIGDGEIAYELTYGGFAAAGTVAVEAVFPHTSVKATWKCGLKSSVPFSQFCELKAGTSNHVGPLPLRSLREDLEFFNGPSYS